MDKHSLFGHTDRRTRSSTHPRTSRRIRRSALALGAGLALAAAFPGSALAAPSVAASTNTLAAPPQALPGNADALAQRFQPAYDYDKDGCYPTPAIGRDGTVAPGLKTSGALNGHCRDRWDLRNTNGYARYKCDNGWCAIMYALYFEKDQVSVLGGGHRHDLEHVVVWVRNNQARYVATSAHGKYTVRRSDQIQWQGTHPKIVYHKDGIATHAFRFATPNDEPPENHDGRWQFPALVGWNGFPPGIRDRLVSADFGSARLDLKDGRFAPNLAKAMPSGIRFNPNA
ncbi:NPP1 family protein [Spongiactinospora sp. TRM90649]|uniref:NPP1 family protein n=1 Tax=Spongiactinospora sp. TRM90649 TaxID=3031114 RepID=UPI0023F648D4|nr:NPP1 family protein [Spongiactinospora sp. TRM90649]MDF5755551.1 NPP1 family protein [Spongiactinospora sp. TRM90649]